MLDNRSGVLYACGAILLAGLLRLLPDQCPLERDPAPEVSFDDPSLGRATNLAVLPRQTGALLVATAANGRHRVVQNESIPKNGRYRISVETANQGSQHFMIEAGGGLGQKYARVIVNPKTGKFIEKSGDLADAGVEPVVGRPGWYRWWVDMDFVAGNASFDFAILDADDQTDFIGSNACEVTVAHPTFSPVSS